MGLGGMIGGGPLGGFEVSRAPPYEARNPPQPQPEFQQFGRPEPPPPSLSQANPYPGHGRQHPSDTAVHPQGTEAAAYGASPPIAPPPTRLLEGFTNGHADERSGAPATPSDSYCLRPPPPPGVPPRPHQDASRPMLGTVDWGQNTTAGCREDEEDDAEDVVFGAAVLDSVTAPQQVASKAQPPPPPPPRPTVQLQPPPPPPGRPQPAAPNGYLANHSSPAPTPSAVPSPPVQQKAAPVPEYVVERDGAPYCLLCSAWADDWHLKSKKHTKRAENPEWYLWDEDTDYTSTNTTSQSVATTPPNYVAGRPPPPPQPSRPPVPSPMPSAPGLYLQPGMCSPGPYPFTEGNAPMAATNGGAVGTGKTCSWCSKPAMERAIEGTKAKYCGDCWEWWLREQSGPQQLAAPSAANGHPPPPAPTIANGHPPPPPHQFVGQPPQVAPRFVEQLPTHQPPPPPRSPGQLPPRPSFANGPVPPQHGAANQQMDRPPEQIWNGESARPAWKMPKHPPTQLAAQMFPPGLPVPREVAPGSSPLGLTEPEQHSNIVNWLDDLDSEAVEV